MGYQLIYNSSFKDIDENTINIEIYRDSGGTLIASELLCSADAVSINYESDDDSLISSLSTSVISVATKPGATALTVIPLLASSLAMVFVSPMTPALLAA